MADEKGIRFHSIEEARVFVKQTGKQFDISMIKSVDGITTLGYFVTMRNQVIGEGVTLDAAVAEAESYVWKKMIGTPPSA